VESCRRSGSRLWSIAHARAFLSGRHMLGCNL
jgi:hypothetical protein